jgi:thiamine-phosphate pyrophosphorylase
MRWLVALLPLLLRRGAVRGGTLSTLSAAPTVESDLLVISPGDAGSADAARSLEQTCAALSGCGVRRLLLREPHLPREQVERLVESLLPLYPRDGLILHEKCAGARAIAQANGIGLHLKSTSDWRAERAEFCGPLGVSAHSEAEAQLAAQYGCNWAFLSPVARPTSKPGDSRPPIGEAAVLRAQRRLPELDVVALGGVTPASAARLAAGGGRGVAVLGGIFRAGHATATADACAAATTYLDALAGVTTTGHAAASDG